MSSSAGSKSAMSTDSEEQVAIAHQQGDETGRGEESNTTRSGHHYHHHHSANDSMVLHEVKGPHWKRNWMAFWFIGMINNFFYCIVLDAADHIAQSFQLKSYIALIAWANIFFGLFAKMVNAFVFVRTSYNKRIAINAVLVSIGIIVAGTAKYWNVSNVFGFAMALIGITFIGMQSAYGESVILGYLERFPSKLVGAWSSGTGMSGVAAALLYLLFINVFEMSNTATFFILTPLIALALFMFFFVIKVDLSTLDHSQKPREEFRAHSGEDSGPVLTPSFQTNTSSMSMRTATSEDIGDDMGEDDRKAKKALLASQHTVPYTGGPGSPLTDDSVLVFGSNWKYAPWAPMPPLASLPPESTVEDEQHHPPPGAGKSTFQRTKEIHRLILWNDVNLMAVYVFEYAAQFMAPFAFPCVAQNNSDKFLLKNAYVLSQFAYQIGVLCSRSSLACIRIKRVYLLSILQFINMIGWLLQAKVLFLSSNYDGLPKDYSGSSAEKSEEWFTVVLLIWMFYVGLLGGAAYVNVFYNILNMEELRIPDENEVEGGKEAYEAVISLVKKDRELAMNIGAIYAVIGITLGSLVDVIFSNTILTTSCSE